MKNLSTKNTSVGLKQSKSKNYYKYLETRKMILKFSPDRGMYIEFECHSCPNCGFDLGDKKLSRCPLCNEMINSIII